MAVKALSTGLNMTTRRAFEGIYHKCNYLPQEQNPPIYHVVAVAGARRRRVL